MTLTEFRLRFPEFTTSSDVMVQTLLDDVDKTLSLSAWGSYRNQAHGLMTAHRLAIAPMGQTARLQTQKGETTYMTQFTQLRNEMAVGLRLGT